MEILHVTAECYPMAKAGGLADVAGALPKYENRLGHVAKVVMPMHRTKFLYENTWEVVHKGSFNMEFNHLEFTIIKEATNKLGFDLYCVDIHGILDREKIYGYDDDADRFLSFQIAVCEWVNNWEHTPDLIHIHDHHTGLIPFMLQQCYAYRKIANIPTVLTIHNAQYQGWMGWEKAALLPAWNTWKWGLLDWSNVINPLACAIKCADRVTTVSPGYMKELMYDANGLESLIRDESYKCTGIINGIDYEVWDPANDSYLEKHFTLSTADGGKKANKKILCKQFDFDPQYPLFIFIGRLVAEKAADLFPEFLVQAFATYPEQFNFLILGSGDPAIENALSSFNNRWIGFYNARMEYNEKLSHEMYAGADFLMMPSRVEPCGLNQMYSMRYGTIPVVRRTGGLQDTVIDFGEQNGYGICFSKDSVADMLHAFGRGINLYNETKKVSEIRKRMMEVPTSWENSAQNYIDLYLTLQ